MSRTFRRPNFEKEHRKVHGSSIVGYYTKYDYFTETYRLPTKEELWKDFRRAHGENQESWRTFKKQERTIVTRQHRSREKKKIVNFLKGITEDVIHEVLPKYPSWWWA